MTSRRIFAAVVLLCAFTAPSHAQKTKAQLNTEITTTYPDNTSGLITPAGVRAYESDVINSIMPTAPVVAGNLACFNGTTGLLQDCGSAPASANITVGTTIVTGGPGILYNSGSGGVLSAQAPGAGVLSALGVAVNTASGPVVPVAALTANGVVYGGGSGVSPGSTAAGANGQLFLGVSSGAPQWGTMGGDATIANTGAITFATVNSNVGTFGSATTCITTTQNAKGLTTAISAQTCTPAVGSITGLGTGVATLLGGTASGTGGPVGSVSPTITGSFTATGLVTLADHATQAANTFVANVTSGTASPTAAALPACTGSASALQYVSGTGLTCGTITAAASSISAGTTTVNGGPGVLSNTTSGGTLVSSTTLPSGLTIPTPTITGALTYGGVLLASSVTGTGSMVLSTSPTFTGTVTAPTFAGSLTGHASLDLALTGGTMSGAIAMGSNAITGAAGITGTILNATTGFEIAGAATSGNYLRGNGTNFVSNTIQAADLPLATNVVKGAMEGDGSTISCVAGVCTATGSSATSVTPGTTTVSGGSAVSGGVLTNTAGVLSNSSAGTLGQALISSGGTSPPTFQSGTWVLLNTLTAAGSASLDDTTHITSSYNEYMLVFENVLPASSATSCEILLHIGGVFQTASYQTTLLGGNNSAAFSTSSTTFMPCGSTGSGANSGLGSTGEFILYNPTGGQLGKAYTGTYSQSSASFPGTIITGIASGMWNGTSPADGFRVIMSSGNITSGTVKLYGRL